MAAQPPPSVTLALGDMWLSEFRLAPDDPAWGRPNVIDSDRPLIAFPRTSVGIAQQGRSEVIADPMRAMLYAAGQPYRRRLVSRDGDDCAVLAMSHELAAEAALSFDGAAADPETYRFPFAAASIGTTEYEVQQCVRHLAGGDRGVDAEVDLEGAREDLYWLVAKVVANGYGSLCERRHGWSESRRAQDQVVEFVREMVGRDLTDRQSLGEMGMAVGYSPFHLARVFRTRTGQSIHEYRTTLRLRMSLAPIADGESLADIALRLGFASQSHLTDRFRRVYGVSPHRWREQGPARALKLSRNMEAEARTSRIA